MRENTAKAFIRGRVLGRGALSCLYKGKIGLFGTLVAIKKLDKQDEECSKAFCRELMIASSLHSPYIIRLVGFCIGPQEDLFLVYKYVSCGSLKQFLHEKKKTKGNTSLPWSVRYKIVVGIAKVVEYLHNGTERCVVHGDIKPSNILLSFRKTPKLCDFGLATWTRAPSIHFLCKTVKGTFGYLAPEYFQHEKISDKTDIYAPGVVLLELVTGRKPIEIRKGIGEENLISWEPSLEVVDCSTCGSSGYAITGDLNLLKNLIMKTDARYIFVVEKHAIFQRLTEDRVFNQIPCIFITAKGYPDIATRFLLDRISRSFPDLPILGLVDWNPADLAILCTFKYGSMGLEAYRYGPVSTS